MKDSTLQRVRENRRTISKRFNFDSHKLVRFYQERQKKNTKQGKS